MSTLWNIVLILSLRNLMMLLLLNQWYGMVLILVFIWLMRSFRWRFRFDMTKGFRIKTKIFITLEIEKNSNKKLFRIHSQSRFHVNSVCQNNFCNFHIVFHNGIFGMRFQVLSILKLFALRIEEYANAAPLCKIFTKREKSLFIHTTTTALPTFFLARVCSKT